MLNNISFILLVFLILLTVLLSQNINYDEKYLTPGKEYHSDNRFQPRLSIYCYQGIPQHILHVWQTVQFAINLKSEEYDLYRGATTEEVLSKYENQKSSWTSPFFVWRSDIIQMDPFNHSCVGIDTKQDHRVVLNILRIDLWRVSTAAFAVALFLMAPRLSSNPLFYYICGVTLGITMSFLILVYLISKLIPRKPAVYGFMVGGWAVGVYLIQILWQNIRTLLVNYQSSVLAYIACTGLVSFGICYRFGPVTDQRSKNLIKWMMQGTALVTLFYSSQYREASVLFMILLLAYYNFPHSWSSSLLALWKRQFPPKTRLLTEDEYHEQGARETVKALDELRTYCSSPECNQWKTVLKLREPIRYKSERFAQFMEGTSHLTDSEVLKYESDSKKNMAQLTDDSESEDDY